LTSDHSIHYVPSLAGRRVVDGAYTRETGFKKPDTEIAVRRIYEFADPNLIRKYNINYILVGPHELQKYDINWKELSKFRLVYSESCDQKIYAIFDTNQLVQGPWPLNSFKLFDGRRYFLSDLHPFWHYQDLGMLAVDKSFGGGKINLDGKSYKKGIGTHANSEIIYSLEKGSKFFESDVGLDDSQDHCSGSVVFSVYIDGILKQRTPIMRWNSKTEHIKVSLENAVELNLSVSDAGDGNICDHANWADAMVY